MIFYNAHQFYVAILTCIRTTCQLSLGWIARYQSETTGHPDHELVIYAGGGTDCPHHRSSLETRWHFRMWPETLQSPNMLRPEE